MTVSRPFLPSSLALALLAILTLAACQATNAPLTVTAPSNNGTWDITKTFPGSAFYENITNQPTSPQICAGSTITGNAGSAVCETVSATLDVTLPPDVLAGTTVWDSSGNEVAGTIAANGVWDLRTSFAVAGGAGYFSGVSHLPTNSVICTGQTILGLSGTGICQNAIAGSPAAASDVLIGKQTWNGAGAVFTGTFPNMGGTWNISTTAFPGVGAYTGITGAPGPTGACAGITIAGTLSTTICETTTSATPAAAADIVASKKAWSGTGTLLTGTLANVGTWDARTTFPGIGNYAGVSNVPAATVFCAGTTYITSAGSAVCLATPATTATPAVGAQIKPTYHAWNNSGAVIPGTMTIQSSLDPTVTYPGSGYYPGITSANLPLASQYCTGTTIFGVAGTADCAASTLTSNTNRDLGVTQLQQDSEVTTYAGAALPTGYRDVPVATKDDDGYNGINMNYVTRPSTDCGLSGILASRITNCGFAWSGAAHGNSGQATWSLVTRNGANKEVWQDQHTGLLWSSLVAGVGATPADDWCEAAGDSEVADPTCSGNTISYCAETGLSPDVVLGENWVPTTPSYSAAKGLMGKNSAPAVRWRLPTVHDYEQAEIDGIRMVMPDMGLPGGWRPSIDTSAGVTSGNEWTASMSDQSTANAFVFHADYGYVNFGARTSMYAIRCVGR